MYEDKLAEVIRSYDSRIVRAYSRIRFLILRQRFLDEIGQYLPAEGRVLDIGCGFGLFALYYAAMHPRLRFHGLDINHSRIAMARLSAERLGRTNVTFTVGDAAGELPFDGPCQGAYMLDLVHHIPVGSVRPLLERLHGLVAPGGRLIVKDVDTRPGYKRAFTYLLDRLMDRTGEIHYWPSQALRALLSDVGFEVYCHAIVDYLPYPHLIYICYRLP
jgi:ubiquinone/menaquinone biosynthesis C-methylase UbiE